MTLYHGTAADLTPGDVLRCAHRGRYAYATPHLYTARVFGPNVYIVEPLQAGEPWEAGMRMFGDLDGEAHREVVSTVGFRVLRPAGDLPEDPTAECYLHAWVGTDEDHDCADHQIVGFHAVGAAPTTEPCPGEQSCEDCQEALPSDNDD